MNASLDRPLEAVMQRVKRLRAEVMRYRFRGDAHTAGVLELRLREAEIAAGHLRHAQGQS